MTPEQRAARERKQKIFVVVGGLVLVLLLAIQLPKVLGGGSDSASPETSETTEATEATTQAETTAPEPKTEAPTTVAVSLGDTDRPLPSDPRKLRSLRSFSGKDPFVQQVDTPTPEAGGEAGSAADGPGDGEEPQPEENSAGFSVGQATASATVISVNGVRPVLSPGDLFPTASPTFVLVAEQPSANTVSIGVAGGQYEGGAKVTKLTVRKPLVLVNTTTGASYRLVLVSVGDGSAAADEASADDRKNAEESR
jgi:hypothetical protein